jgi:hypothetical protein
MKYRFSPRRAPQLKPAIVLSDITGALLLVVLLAVAIFLAAGFYQPVSV